MRCSHWSGKYMISDCIRAAFFLLICSFFPNLNAARQLDSSQLNQNRTFQVDAARHVFLKNGKPFQYISGSLHYFRIRPIYWRDRLEKAKAAGLDAVQIYIPWNFHSPAEGVYNFEGDRDVENFLQLIAQLDLLAIVRAGPYICAEWSFGGLPPWLLTKNPQMNIRSSDPEYFNYVTQWFGVLLPKLKKHLYVNGGPIIMIQLENEYGSYPLCDARYMVNLHKLARHHLGSDVVLFTTDGASVHLLRCGSPDPGLLSTIDFGPSNLLPNVSFSSLQQFNASLPWVNSEFYTGWYDWWGGNHSRSNAEILATNLLRLMRYSPRVSVNMYMFHGGTTFGFWSGNNFDGSVTTSYDFDAPISEAGDITLKYERLRKAIYEFKNMTPPPLPKNTTKRYYGQVSMKLVSHIVCSIDHMEPVKTPINMEAKSQYEGLGLYIGTIPVISRGNKVNVTMGKFSDVAHLYTSTSDINSIEWHITLNRNTSRTILHLEKFPAHTHLVVVIENTGYVNYGHRMKHDIKGLFGDVMIGGKAWSHVSMGSIKRPLNIQRCERPKGTHSKWPIQGGIFTGKFDISTADEVHDTFIQLDSFGRGLVAINDVILGRYNQLLGPQQRLYIPKDFLRSGTNRIVAGELQALTANTPTVSLHTTQKWSR